MRTHQTPVAGILQMRCAALRMCEASHHRSYAYEYLRLVEWRPRSRALWAIVVNLIIHIIIIIIIIILIVLYSVSLLWWCLRTSDPFEIYMHQWWQLFAERGVSKKRITQRYPDKEVPREMSPERRLYRNDYLNESQKLLWCIFAGSSIAHFNSLWYCPKSYCIIRPQSFICYMQNYYYQDFSSNFNWTASTPCKRISKCVGYKDSPFVASARLHPGAV